MRPYPTGKVDVKKDKWYTFKVEVAGGSHKVSVDGDVLIEYKDAPAFKGGKLAFGSWSADLEVTHFDDLIITGPGIASQAVDRVNKLTATWGGIKGGY